MATTIKQYYDNMFGFNTSNTTKFIIREGDMFEIAKEYYNPVIHNFGNNFKPGGYNTVFTSEGKFVSTITTDEIDNQEIQLIKKYKDKIILPENMYPIINDDKTALLYSFCEDLPAVITMPCILNPNLKKKKTYYALLERLELMLYSSCLNDNTLITGLWGCGFYGMKPEELLDLWKTVLMTAEHKQKTEKKYHEAISNVDKYTEPELDSFYSNRYK